MNRTRTWMAVAALVTTFAAWPLTAAAQEMTPATSDPMIIVGWQDDDGGPIYAQESDLPAIMQAQARRSAQIVAEPNLLAGGMGDCMQ